MCVVAQRQRTGKTAEVTCLSERRIGRSAVLVLQLVLCLGWVAAGLAQTANCSNTCSATADLQSKGSGQLEVSCTPGSLQQVPGLVLHPLLLNLSGSLQGAAWLQQRWQQAGRPRSLFSASGACLTLHLKRTVFGGLDLGRLGLSSLVAVRGGARLIVDGMDCLGVKGGSCMSVVGAGQVMLRALNISGVQAEGGMAAVQVSNSTSVSLSRSSFTSNRGRHAGAVLLEGLQAVQVQDSTWQGNVGTGIKRDGGAGALAVRRTGRVQLASSKFTNNTAERGSGGAVSCLGCGQQVYRALTFASNTAVRGAGGGLHQNSSSSSTQLLGVVFESNRASTNGGGLSTYAVDAASCATYVPPCHTMMEGCSFVGNQAGVGPFAVGGGGGGMYAEQLTGIWRAIIVANGTFINNSAASQSMSSVQSMDVDSAGAGGAIGVSGQQNIATFVYNTTFQRNTAAYGGAITLIWGGGLLCRNCTFRHNSAWSHGGAVMVYRVATSQAINQLELLRTELPVLPDSADAFVGGTFQPSSNSSSLDEQYLLTPGALTMQACRFEHNHANLTGGDIHAWIPQQNVVISGSTLLNSRAGLRGGSISLIGGIFVATGSVFSNCRAGAGGGGAVHVDGADAASLITVYGAWSMFVDVARCAFINNTAEGPGGAMFATGITAVNLVQSVVDGNTAGAGPGGGLAVSGVQLMQVLGSVVRNNRALAGAGGGAACSSCTSLLVADSTLCGNRALKGGGLDYQGSTSVPSWASIINSTISGNAAVLPTSAPPSQRMASLGLSGGASPLATPSAAAGVAAGHGTPLSTPATMLASEQGMDEYHALFGVGGGLRLVAASLLATNSSLGGNSAARLGQQVALVQACWRDAARNETLPGSYDLMEVPGGAKCTFAHLTGTVDFEDAPCKEYAPGPGNTSNSSSSSRGVRTCPDLMPQSFCSSPKALQSCSGSMEVEAVPADPSSSSSGTSPFFMAMAVLSEGDGVQPSPVAPYMNNCTLNFTSLPDSLVLDTKRECEVGSTTWGAGCQCLQGWVYTTYDAQESGPYNSCQPLDWVVPWCVINITTCTSTPCGTWDSCKATGDLHTLPSRPPFQLVTKGTCQRGWQLPESLAAGVHGAAGVQQAAAGSSSSNSSDGCAGSSRQADGVPVATFTTSPAQVLLLPDPLDVLMHQPGRGSQQHLQGAAAPAAVGDYQPYTGWVPSACKPLPSAVAGAADWGAYPTLQVTTISSNTLPPLVLLAAGAAGNPLLTQHSPAAVPALFTVTVQLVVGGNEVAAGSSSSPSAGQDEVVLANVGDNARASVSGLSSAVYATSPDLYQQLLDPDVPGDGGSPVNGSRGQGVQLSRLLHVSLPALQLHAGPGRYWLRFTDTSLPASLPPPAAVCLLVDVLPCGLGEVSGASSDNTAAAGAAGSPHDASNSGGSSSGNRSVGVSRSVQLAATAGCNPCEAGTFSLVPSATACQPCIQGGECPGGSALTSARGWWHPFPLATSVVPCLHPSACVAADGRRQLALQQAAVTAVQRYAAVGAGTSARSGHRRLQQAAVGQDGGSRPPWDAAAYWSAQCAEGHGGPVCGVCDTGWVPQAGQACSRCSQHRWLLVLLQVLGFLLLLGLMLLAAQRIWVCGLRQRTTTEPQIMQVAMLWLQLLGLMPLLSTPWPQPVEGVLLLASSIIYGSTGFGSNGLSLDCLVDSLLLSRVATLAPGQMPPAAIRLVLKVLVLPLVTSVAAVLAQAAGSALWLWATQRWQHRLPAHRLHPNLAQLQRSWAHDKSLGAAGHSSGNAPTSEAAPASQLGTRASCSFLGLPWTRVVVLVLVVLQVQYPGVLYAALSTFRCVSVPLPRQDPSTALRQLAASSNSSAADTRDPAAAAAAVWSDAWGLVPVRLWVLDMRRECYTGYHLNVLLPASLVGLVVWGVGLPAALLVLALKACKAAKPRTLKAQGKESVVQLPNDPACQDGLQQHQQRADQHQGQRRHCGGAMSSVGSNRHELELPLDAQPSASEEGSVPGSAHQHNTVMFMPCGHSSAAMLGKDAQQTMSGAASSEERHVEGPEGAAPEAAPPAGMSEVGHCASVATRCLSAAYRPGAMWWPAAQLLLLFMLVATTVFAGQAGAAMQPAFMLLPLTVMYVSLQACRPHHCGVQGVLTMLVVGAAGLLLYIAVALGVCSGSIPGQDSLRQHPCTLPPSPTAPATLVFVLILLPLLAMAYSVRQVVWWGVRAACLWLLGCSACRAGHRSKGAPAPDVS